MNSTLPNRSYAVLILILLLSFSVHVWADVPFEHVIVDREGPKDPWAKILGDIDGDGFADIVIGGRRGPLVWYKYPDWSKATITDGGYRTVDGELGDVDADGDLDVVMGGLFWYENPRPSGDPAGGAWKTHKVADHPTHDVELGDLDGDGDLDIVTRDQSEFGHKAGNRIHLWRQEQTGKWAEKVIDCPHGEAITLGDIDKDGDPDIVIGGIWFENTGDIVNGKWSAHEFGKWHPNATVQVADINGDSRPDVVLSPSELKGQTYKLSWFEAHEDPKKKNWREHVIADPVECVIHGLVTADINGDGATDVVASEMHQGADPDEVSVFINSGDGSSWVKQVISKKGSHYIRVADIGNDGDMDIVGANWSGPYQPIEMCENKSKARAWRIPITACAAGHERLDKPVEVEVNFTELLEKKAGATRFDERSMRLAEVDSEGRLIEASIGFQFDEAPDFSRADHVKGMLTFVAKGNTPAGSTRTFHLYLDSTDVVHTKPLVSVLDGIQYRDQESFKIETPNGTYYYHKKGAGFASIFDKDGNDWLGYRPGGGPAGEYRGIPNLGYPEGYCHPGKEVSNSRIVSDGPIKISIISESNDGKMKCVWDIFPHYARLTVLKMRTPYWFLYEGTPGGKLDEDSDYCIRADKAGGTRTPASKRWDGDISTPGGPGEWLCFGDGDRVLYLVHHEDDEAVDSYWPMRGEMTVFGFGRKGLKKFMKATPAQFTIGFHDGLEFADITRAVNSAYNPLIVAVGDAELVGRK